MYKTRLEELDWRFFQRDVERSQEMPGLRFFARTAGLDVHPMDGVTRTDYLRRAGGVGMCNITKCCTEVCPEGINITDNAIIPGKERVVDAHADPLRRLFRRSGQG